MRKTLIIKAILLIGVENLIIEAIIKGAATFDTHMQIMQAMSRRMRAPITPTNTHQREMFR